MNIAKSKRNQPATLTLRRRTRSTSNKQRRTLTTPSWRSFWWQWTLAPFRSCYISYPVFKELKNFCSKRERSSSSFSQRWQRFWTMWWKQHKCSPSTTISASWITWEGLTLPSSNSFRSRPFSRPLSLRTGNICTSTSAQSMAACLRLELASKAPSPGTCTWQCPWASKRR